MYSYTQGGLPAAKRLQVNEWYYWRDTQGFGHNTTITANLDSKYTYNAEGGITSITYPSTGPSNAPVAGASYNCSYDSMYRLAGMTTSTGTTVVNGVSYNAANQLLTMDYPGANETRTYNSLNQLKTLTSTGENLTYNYPTGTNNGKISSMSNAISGETITYTYDSLNRLLTANGSGWGEQYGFDPFGNLLSKTVTAGSGPSLSVTVNPANNQIQGVSGVSYDANGNQSVPSGGGYDAENRFIGLNGSQYAYDAQNKRIWNWSGALDTYGNATGYTLIAYSPSGQRLGAYSLAPYPNLQNGTYTPYLQVTLSTTDEYFGSRRLAVIDQLGSAGTYFPWGEDKGSTNPQNAWSFATYWRDSASGLDYASNRYYNNAYGRFMTPDPYKGRAGGPGDPRNPQSWNRYAYTVGDPVNFYDPAGTDYCDPEDPCIPCDPDDPSCDGGGDGGQGGGGGSDPLQCWLSGFTTSTASFQYFAGTTTHPRTYYYFGVPIDLYFQASGGTGTYTFQVFPYVSSVGTATYQNKSGPGLVTASWHPDPTNPGGFVQSGANATFEDAPGIPFYVPGTNGAGKLISASVTFYGTTAVWVTSGNETVSCGVVYWTATVSVEADAVLNTAGYLFSGNSSVTSYSP